MKKLDFKEIETIITNYLSLESFADRIEDNYDSLELNFDEDSDIENIEELLKLKSLSESKEGDYDFDWEDFNKQICILLGLGEFVGMDSYGGEDQGSSYWSVVYFKEHDIYIKFIGWYTSYSGHTWNGMREVKPKEVTMTIYE